MNRDSVPFLELPRSMRRYASAHYVAARLAGQTVADRLLGRAREAEERRALERLRAMNDRAPTAHEPVREADWREGVGTGLVPLVFRGAARDWAATKTWTLDALAERFGDHPIRGVDLENPEVSEPLANIVAAAKRGEPLYARFSTLLHEHPELIEELDHDTIRFLMAPAKKVVEYQFFMGGANTQTPMHCALGSNLFVQAHGRKRWWLYHPSCMPYFRPTVQGGPFFITAAAPEKADPQFPDVDRIPGLHVELEAGDLMYVPPHWWHRVINPTPSIGVGIRWLDLKRALQMSKFMTAMIFGATNPPLWVHFKPGGIERNHNKYVERAKKG